MKDTRHHFGHVTLSPLETCFNWLVWMPLNILPFYLAYHVSRQYQTQFSQMADLQQGWFGYEKDFNDSEWNYWHPYAFLFFVLFAFCSLLIFVAKVVCLNLLQEVMIVTALIIHSYVLSINALFLIIIQVVCFYQVVLFRSKTFLWVFTCAMIIGIHNEAVKSFVLQTLYISNESSTLVGIAFMMNILRLISFGCFVLEHDEEEYSFILCLNYVLYVPLFYNGPVITYDVFCRDFRICQIQHSSKAEQDDRTKSDPDKPNCVSTIELYKSKFSEVSKDFISCVVYYFAFELFLHFVYMNALSINHWMLEKMTSLDVVMISWVHLHIFNIKYFIFYRFTGLFAKLDGFTPPGPPKCIASLYTFVDMWRYFDKGLYRLLQQCIYIPLGGSKAGIARQIIASCSCFLFVGFWHGGNKTFMFWALTNWMGIVGETLLRIALNTRIGVVLKQNIGAAMYRRLCALGGSFSVYALIYTNMVFLIGLDGAAILLKCLTYQSSIVILLVLYFTNQCSIDVN